MNFQGGILYLPSAFYAAFLQPIAHLKLWLEQIYLSLLRLIFPDLPRPSSGPPYDRSSPAINPLMVLLGLVMISLFAYYLRGAITWFVLGLTALWFAESRYSQQRFQEQGIALKTSLEADDQGLLNWQMNLPNGKTRQKQFAPDAICGILLKRREVRGGSFWEPLATVWVAYLVLRDRSQYVLDEAPQAINLLRKMLQLAQPLNTLVKFADSEGKGEYVQNQVDVRRYSRLAKETIKVQETDYKWHIYSQWSFANTRPLLGRMFQQAGLFLFLVLVLGVMVRFGQVMAWGIDLFRGQPPALSRLDLIQLVTPKITWPLILHMVLGAIPLYRASANLIQEKNIFFGRNSLTVNLDDGRAVGFQINKIRILALVKGAVPAVLIMDASQGVEIQGLSTLAEFRALMYHIDRGLEAFAQKQPQES